MKIDFFLPRYSYYNTSKCCLNIASSRIINPIDDYINQDYPWMAFLLIKEEAKTTKQNDVLPQTCTGAVISSRYYK